MALVYPRQLSQSMALRLNHQLGSRLNEWPLSGESVLFGNGEDGRIADRQDMAVSGMTACEIKVREAAVRWVSFRPICSTRPARRDPAGMGQRGTW
jgi:hypothetical protein